MPSSDMNDRSSGLTHVIHETLQRMMKATLRYAEATTELKPYIKSRTALKAIVLGFNTNTDHKSVHCQEETFK